MYSFNLVNSPRKCAACGLIVRSRLAGHWYQEPLCDPCFRLAAPTLFEEVSAMRPESSVQLLETRLHTACANCGGNLLGQRFAGHHHDDPLCTFCLEQDAPELAALLMLEEAVLEAADGGRDAPGLLKVAIAYSRRLYRLDAERPRTPLPTKRRGSK